MGPKFPTISCTFIYVGAIMDLNIESANVASAMKGDKRVQSSKVWVFASVAVMATCFVANKYGARELVGVRSATAKAISGKISAEIGKFWPKLKKQGSVCNEP